MDEKVENKNINSEHWKTHFFVPKGYNLDIVNKVVIKGKEFLPVVRCKNCQWGREVCGNIECLNSDIPLVYHGYEWFCPNGEAKKDLEENDEQTN